jgi:hypothetical protein
VPAPNATVDDELAAAAANGRGGTGRPSVLPDEARRADRQRDLTVEPAAWELDDKPTNRPELIDQFGHGWCTFVLAPGLSTSLMEGAPNSITHSV